MQALPLLHPKVVSIGTPTIQKGKNVAYAGFEFAALAKLGFGQSAEVVSFTRIIITE